MRVAVMTKTKLIIDTDGVADDIRAICIAMQHPDVEILAFTTTHGCVSIIQAAANVARAQRANKLQKNIPIYKGATRSFIKKEEEPDESFFFGKDGIGGAPKDFPEVLESDFNCCEDEVAALALIRLFKEHPDTTLVCLGPLTNVALALKLDDAFKRLPKKVVIMGGNYYAIGNVHSFSSSEFNFFGDPEAASIVLSEMESPLTLVPWEAHCIDGVRHEKEVDFHAHLSLDSPLASFLSTVSSVCRAEYAKSGRQYAFCDEIAVCTAIDPEGTVVEKKEFRVSVELAGTFSRGQVVVDWTEKLWEGEGSEGIVDKNRRPVTFVTGYNAKHVERLVRNAVNNVKW